MWGTGGKFRELRINLHQWEPSCMNPAFPSAAKAMTANRPDIP